MSMSVNLHTKTASKFEVSAKLRSNSFHDSTDKYALINIVATPDKSYDYQEITIFPSFEQAKQLHKELSKLMKEMATLEKRTKAEIHAKNMTNSKAQKFIQMVEAHPYGIIGDLER
jgi:PHP family Zn ribbon phosphoesterase